MGRVSMNFPSLLLQPGGPVDDEMQIRKACLFDGNVDKKALPICGYIIEGDIVGLEGGASRRQVKKRRGRLVKYAAKREQVGPRIERFASRLLGRHVGNRSDNDPGVVRRLTVFSSLRFTPAIGIGLASPKSRIFACPRGVTNIFAGLMSR